jgi:autotransporter-associated beta strand protein
VKGGQVTVTSSSLTGSNAVVIGLADPLESYGSVSSVILPNATTYSGGTTLNSGYLYVGNNNSLGTGAVSVAPTSAAVGIEPFGGAVTLPNNIAVPYSGLQLNYTGSLYTLTLGGVISNSFGAGELLIDGPVTLTGNNTYSGSTLVNGTTLTVGSANGLGASALVASSGSTINFSAMSPQVAHMSLTGTTADFTYAGGSPSLSDVMLAAGSTLTFANNSNPTIDSFKSDAPNSGNVINLGTGAVLTFELASDPEYHGTMQGAGALVVDGGSLVLSGANTYGGGTTITSTGSVVASNSSALGSGGVTVSGGLATNTGVTIVNPITLTGGTLAGFGTFSPGGNLTIQGGAVLAPGIATVVADAGGTNVPAVGTLTFGGGTSLTFGHTLSTGGLNFSIADATGVAGTGYSLLAISGSLTITATAGSEFYIHLYSFDPATNQAGNAANFNAGQGYSWLLVSTGSGISNFSPSAFIIDQSNFTNSTGQFSVSQSGNDLMLNFTPVPEPSTWALLASGLLTLGAVVRRRRR